MKMENVKKLIASCLILSLLGGTASMCFGINYGDNDSDSLSDIVFPTYNDDFSFELMEGEMRENTEKVKELTGRAQEQNERIELWWQSGISIGGINAGDDDSDSLSDIVIPKYDDDVDLDLMIREVDENIERVRELTRQAQEQNQRIEQLWQSETLQHISYERTDASTN